jgi:uncharacterized protein
MLYYTITSSKNHPAVFLLRHSDYTAMLDLLPFLPEIASQYTLDPTHIHGLSHWARVLENGLRLAEQEGGDLTVISLFAIFHDSCRQNQAWDPGHGARGAALAEKMLQGHPQVNPHQLTLLAAACRDHTDGLIDAELSIQICWDADRLDLARVGISPQPERLCTPAARDAGQLDWANHRARRGYSPPYVASDWMPYFTKG